MSPHPTDRLSEPTEISAAVRRLGGGAEELRRALATERAAAVWHQVIARFRDPASPERRRLDPLLAAACGLSEPGLRAGLDAVLGSVDGPEAVAVFEQARDRVARDGPPPTGPVVAWTASNIPALAVQPLLPAVAAGRPLLIKSPSREPYFADAFVRALHEAEPAFAGAVAAGAWQGGDREIEDPILQLADRVLAYGEAATIRDLERRAPGKVVGFGPKTSLAVLGGDRGTGTAEALARDVALFDQRGCLSVTAVYVLGRPEESVAVAEALRNALAEQAEIWPPGPVPTGAAAAVQHSRGEADLAGLRWWPVGPRLGDGTVFLDPSPNFRPGPGLRTVRVHSVAEPDRIPEVLRPWAGRLQGAALGGQGAWALEPALRRLGVSRCAPPGRLQAPDALWHNGGVHPLDLMWERPVGD